MTRLQEVDPRLTLDGDAMPQDGVVPTDLLGRVSLWTPVWHDGQVCDAELSAVTESHSAGQMRSSAPVPGLTRLTEIAPGAVADGRLALFRRTAEDGEPFRLTTPSPHGGPTLETSAQRSSDGRVIIISRDVTADVDRDSQLARAETRWQRLISDAPLGVTVNSFEGRILEVNQTFCSLLGRDRGELIGERINRFAHSGDDVRMNRDGLLKSGLASMEKRYVNAAGETLWLRVTASMVQEGLDQFILTFFEDITEGVRATAELERRATIDELTGLWNRQAIHAMLRRDLGAVASGTTGSLAVLFLDVDQFKVINDSLGHSAGDQLLAQVAERLRAVIPPAAVLGRTGGDEFLVVLPGGAGAEEVGRTIGTAMQAPVTVDRRPVSVQVSIGIAIATAGEVLGDEPEIALLRDADTALYAAKNAGGAQVITFDERMRSQAMSRLDDEQDLRTALARDQLLVHFQPVRRIAPGGPPEWEALVRWQHPVRGQLSPDQFLGVAEETGLILPMDRRVLELACAQLSHWRRTQPSARMAVNVAAQHLTGGALTQDVFSTLERHGLPPSALTLEVTEQSLISSHNKASVALRELRDAGCRIAIDDFGTGYSSLAYLRELPVDLLKIDRAFVTGLGTDGNDSALFRAVVALGSSLGLETIAEGIETEAELAVAVDAGVTYVQGYLIGRPAPA